MKVKRILAILVALSMLLSFPIAFADSLYSDTSGHWAEGAINDLSTMGIIQGDNGLIRPEDLISRAELVTVIYNMVGADGKVGIEKYEYIKASDAWVGTQVSEGTASVARFSDYDSGKWYAQALRWAVANDIISGYEDNTVKAENPVTRQEAVVILARAFGISGDGEITSGDAASVASWAKSAVGTFMKNGFLNGDNNGNVNPTNNIKRGEAFQLLRNMIGLYISGGGNCNGNYGNKLVIINNGKPSLKYLNCGGVLVGAKASLPNIGEGVEAAITIFGGLKIPGKDTENKQAVIINGGGSSGGSSTSNKVTITFETNGGYFRSGETRISNEYSKGLSLRGIMPSDPTRDEYEFVGWCTSKNAASSGEIEKTVDYNGDIKISSSMTLYASWHSFGDDIDIKPIAPLDMSEPAETDLVEDYDVELTSGNIIKISGTDLKKYRYKELGDKKYWAGFDVGMSENILDALYDDEDLRWYIGDDNKYADIEWTGYIADDINKRSDYLPVYIDAEDAPKYFIIEMPKGSANKILIFKIDTDDLSLFEYAEPSEGVAITVSESDDIFGKTAEELMTDVMLSDGFEANEQIATGTLNFFTDYPEPEESGNYIALDIILPLIATDDVTVFINGEEEIFESDEKTVLIKVIEEMEEIVIVVDFDGEGTMFEPTTYTIDVTGLTLKEDESKEE